MLRGYEKSRYRTGCIVDMGSTQDDEGKKKGGRGAYLCGEKKQLRDGGSIIK